MTVKDNFASDVIDPTIWSQAAQGTGWTMAETNGRLRFTFPPGTAPGGEWNTYGGNLGTQCLFPGDFDARVDYTLVDWPHANGVFVSLWSFFKPSNIGWESWRESSPEGIEQYGAFMGQGHASSAPVADSTGSLRLTRHAGVVTASFLHNGHWLRTGYATNARPTIVAVGAESVENPAARSDRVVVDLDNFRVSGVNPTC